MANPVYQYYFFDLDGTLTDSAPGIINSVIYALNRYGISVKDRSSLQTFVGPPLSESFQKYYGFDEERAQQAIAFYREYFREKGMFENRVYDGVIPVLSQLKERGKTLVLATSKPQEFSETILKYFHLYEYFDYIAGATMDGSRSEKKDVIRYAMDQIGISGPKGILMIGDREQDVLGSAALCIDCAGVLYGYGSREELKNAGAKYLLERPEEILTLPGP